MSIRQTIFSQLRQIANEQNKVLAPLTDSLLLADVGFDSLGFAVLVTRLEDVLGVDPFTASTADYSPVTLGELVRLYETAVQ